MPTIILAEVDRDYKLIYLEESEHVICLRTTLSGNLKSLAKSLVDFKPFRNYSNRPCEHSMGWQPRVLELSLAALDWAFGGSDRGKVSSSRKAFTVFSEWDWRLNISTSS